jgi:hypothetical protein
LSVGDILAAATRMVGQRAGLLVPIALLGALLSAAGTVAALSLFPDRTAYFQDRWMSDALTGRAGVPAVVLAPLLTGSLISLVTTFVISGVVAALAAADALGAGTSARSALARLHRRWARLIAVAVVVAAAVLAGLAFLVVPGLIALGALSFAGPAIAVERASAARALRRSLDLSRGIRWRVVGVVVLAALIAGAVGSVIVMLVPPGDTIGSSLGSMLASALVSAVTTPWTAAVVAMLFIDARIRRENLATALVRAAYPL